RGIQGWCSEDRASQERGSQTEADQNRCRVRKRRNHRKHKRHTVFCAFLCFLWFLLTLQQNCPTGCEMSGCGAHKRLISGECLSQAISKSRTALEASSFPPLKTEGNGPVSQPTHPLHPASQPVGQFLLCNRHWCGKPGDAFVSMIC